MIKYKNDEEIELLRQSNLLLGKVHGELAKILKPGITPKQLDKIAEDFILSHGAKPSFKGYKDYPATLCVSVNDTVIHGIPTDYEIKEGDIVSIDCGVLLNGYHGDSAFTYAVGEVDKNVWELMTRTLEALYKGIEQAKPGNRLGDIGFAIQNHVTKYGFSVVREMTGHGIGKKLHEDPVVRNFGRRGQGKKLKKGLVIAIEPMINMGTHEIYVDKDGWTIKTKDGKPSAHYELSIAVRDKGPDILSTFEFIYQALKTNKNIKAPKI